MEQEMSLNKKRKLDLSSENNSINNNEYGKRTLRLTEFIPLINYGLEISGPYDFSIETQQNVVSNYFNNINTSNYYFPVTYYNNMISYDPKNPFFKPSYFPLDCRQIIKSLIGFINNNFPIYDNNTKKLYNYSKKTNLCENIMTQEMKNQFENIELTVDVLKSYIYSR
jgi:hypothetical protein